MKQTERRSLFGKTYSLLCFRCKHRIPHLPKAKSKGVPNQPFYRNLIKEIKKTADIPMMTALQRRHSRNSFQTRRPSDASLAIFFCPSSTKTQKSRITAPLHSHTFSDTFQNRRTIPTSTACTTGCFTFTIPLTATPPRLKLSFNSNAPGIQRRR